MGLYRPPSTTVQLEDFGSIATNQQFTDTLQRAVNSKHFIQLPNGLWTLQQPIEYETLRLIGFGGLLANGVPKTELRAETSLGNELVFHRPGWWLDSSDVRHNEGGLEASRGVGTHVYLQHIVFQPLATESTIIELYNIGPMSEVRNCTFACKRRGVTCIGTFGMEIANCTFAQEMIPSVISDDALLRRSWCLHATGHCNISECNFQGAMTGIVAMGPGCRILGGRLEICHYGLILGATMLHEDAFGDARPFSGEVSFLTTESCRRHIYCHLVTAATQIRGVTLTSAAVAPQPDGSTDEAEYGIYVAAGQWNAGSIMQQISIAGTFSQAGVVAPSGTPNEQIIINNTGSGGSWIEP